MFELFTQVIKALILPLTKLFHYPQDNFHLFAFINTINHTLITHATLRQFNHFDLINENALMKTDTLNQT